MPAVTLLVVSDFLSERRAELDIFPAEPAALKKVWLGQIIGNSSAALTSKCGQTAP
jgi:hypothetical protein